MSDTDRLAGLERRLDALEQQLAQNAPPPASTPWAARTRDDLDALASDQRDLRDQVQSLLGAFLAWRDGTPPPPASLAAPLPPPPRSPWWKRGAGRVLRLPLRVWRGLREFYRGGDWSLAIPEPGRRPAPLSPADVEVLRLGGQGEPPAGLVETALAAMACEDLAFVHIQAESDLLVVRRELGVRGPADLADGLAARLPRRKNAPLGRSVALRVLTSGSVPTWLHGLRRLDDHWRLGGGSLRYPLAAAPAEPRAGAPGGLAILASCPLEYGLDLLLAPLLAAAEEAGRPVALISLLDVRASHGFWGLAGSRPSGSARAMPLAGFFPPESRGLGLAQLLRREAFDRVLQIGPGQSVFDSPDVLAALARVELFDLPLDHPCAALPRPAGLAHRSFRLAQSPGDHDAIPLAPLPLRPGAGRDPASRAAARRRLGLPEEGRLWLWLDDLVAQARPEDALELARRLPDDQIWLVGRGPLDGRVDDLIRYLALENVRRAATADLGEALLAADALVLTGPPTGWPRVAATALAHGVPVAGVPDPRLEGAPLFHGFATLGELEAGLRAWPENAAAPPADPPAFAPAAQPWWRDLLAR